MVLSIQLPKSVPILPKEAPKSPLTMWSSRLIDLNNVFQISEATGSLPNPFINPFQILPHASP